MKSEKSFYIVFLFFVLIFQTSCNNVSVNQIKTEDEITIKNLVQNKEADISWTKEIEAEVLSTPLTVPSEYSKANVPASPDMLKLSRKGNQPVYPELNDFGSLDTSSLAPFVQEKVLKFSADLSSNIYSGPEKYFYEPYKFNYLFFRNDFIEGWKNYFKKDFPYTLEDTKQTDDEGNPVKISLFSKYILGQPFIGAEIISLPVRFYCQEGKIDVTLYISNDNKSLIYQITIDRWVKV